MSVLIRGMEMPTDCINCPFCEYEQGFCLAANEMDTEPREIGERHKDCPLIPVPDHGRLIDADANIKTLIKCAEDPENDIARICYNYASSILDACPTIIPAEGE